MAPPAIEASLASLGGLHRWHGGGAALTATAALMLGARLPALSLPPVQGALLIAGVLVLAARALHHAYTSHRAVKQLRLERRFVRHGPDAASLRRCLRQGGHLWQHSHTFRGMRRIAASPPGTSATAQQHYRHVLAPLCPSWSALDLGAALLLVILLAALGAGALPAHPPALAAATLVLGGEAFLAAAGRRGRRDVDRLAQLVSTWTLTGPLAQLRRGAVGHTYRHTALYQAAA